MSRCLLTHLDKLAHQLARHTRVSSRTFEAQTRLSSIYLPSGRKPMARISAVTALRLHATFLRGVVGTTYTFTSSRSLACCCVTRSLRRGALSVTIWPCDATNMLPASIFPAAWLHSPAVRSFLAIGGCFCFCYAVTQSAVHYIRSFFGCCYATTQLALQLRQEQSQVVCSNMEARKRPAWGHSRNGPWTWRHTHTHLDKRHGSRINRTCVNTQHGFVTDTWNSN